MSLVIRSAPLRLISSPLNVSQMLLSIYRRAQELARDKRIEAKLKLATLNQASEALEPQYATVPVAASEPQSASVPVASADIELAVQK